MKDIGGYLELDLPVNQDHLHPHALRLNTARNAFRFILSRGDIQHVYMPNFICDSMVGPLDDTGTRHTFYTINESLEPASLPDLKDGERLLFVNYFGLKDGTVSRLAERYGHRLIVDNAQALYSLPLPGIDTLYSPRKFVGVPDGAYWYPRQGVGERLSTGLPVATSWQAMAHLAGRLDEGASRHYADYVAYEKSLDDVPVMRMSRVTEMLLRALDYDNYRERRRENFIYLHERLSAVNGMEIDLAPDAVPMVYPLVISRNDVRNEVRKDVRQYLLGQRIYLPRYWVEVLQRPTASPHEKGLVEALLPLPINHRYGREDMAVLADCVEACIT